MTAPTQPRLTEAQFQRQVTELAKMLGWHVYHTFLSKWSEKGFPDLTMVRPRDRRLIFAELKGEKGRLTEAQASWMEVLGTLMVEVPEIPDDFPDPRQGSYLDGIVAGLAKALREYPKVEVHVWRPSDFDAISEALR